jgi:hypothetical protein
MTLGDLPIVRAGAARGSGVSEDDPAVEVGWVDLQRDAAHAVGPQLDGGNAAVERRAIILHPGRHANRLALEVHGGLQEIVIAIRRMRPAGQGAAGSDRQCRRSADSRSCRRLAARRERGVFQPIVPCEVREERQVA